MVASTRRAQTVRTSWGFKAYNVTVNEPRSPRRLPDHRRRSEGSLGGVLCRRYVIELK
jgi:hypothetical protein